MPTATGHDSGAWALTPTGERSVVRCFAGCAEVAENVLGSAVVAAVILVSEVPCTTGLYAVAASPAVDGPCLYLGCPLCSELVVLGVVAAGLSCAALPVCLACVLGAVAGFAWVQGGASGY